MYSKLWFAVAMQPLGMLVKWKLGPNEMCAYVLICVTIHFTLNWALFFLSDMPADSTKVNNFDLRIYDDAPSGTVVSLLDPAVLAPGISPSDLRFRLDGREARRFRLDGHTLLTASRVRKPLGDIYSFNLEVTSRTPHSYVIALWNVTVTVSKKNMHAPRFPQDFFRAEVYRYADIGKKILRITAKDYDEELYNCQVFYSLAVIESSDLFTIETDTGWLKTAASMREAKPIIHLQVVAMDTGSPPLSRAITVTIILRDIAGKVLFTLRYACILCI